MSKGHGFGCRTLRRVVAAPGDEKRVLRASMRAARRAVDRQPERSALICDELRRSPAVRAARVVMVYEAVPGEPDLAAFITWCREAGKRVVVPDPTPTAAAPADLDSIDVAVVPGVAFTPHGRRLGQGGGWYDRVLVRLAPGATTIGVCFAPQLLDDLPTEEHDVVLDSVVTDPVTPREGEP